MRKLQWGVRQTRASLAAVIYMLGLAACAGPWPGESAANLDGHPSAADANAAALSSRLTCDQLLSELRGRLLTQVSERADRARLFVAADESAGAFSDDTGAAFRVPVPAAPAAARTLSVVSAPVVRAGTDPFSAAMAPGPGIEGSDTVQTDAEHIYLLHGSQLFVLDAEPAAATEVLATAPIEGLPLELLVSNRRVVVFSAVSAPSPNGGDESYTKLTVLGAASGTLEVLREIYVEGVYQSARVRGESMRVLLKQHPKPQLDSPSVSYVDVFGHPRAQAEIDLQVDVWALLSTISIEDSVMEDYVPSTFERLDGELVRQPLNCDDYLLPGAVLTQPGSTSVITLELGTDDAPLGNLTLLADVGVYHGGDDAMLLTQFDYLNDDRTAPLVETILHRLVLDGRATYTGTGRVSGSIINVDESNGVIRALTLQNRYAEDVGGGAVYAGPSTHVVTLTADTFAELGRSADFRPDEYVTSSLFMGERAYLVSAGQTTGLAVLDLSDPAAPAMLGQVHTTTHTFQVYPLSDGTLLGLGERFDPGQTVPNVALQLFDVSSAIAPRLAQEFVFPEPGYSRALNDPHALSFNSSRDALALPWQQNTAGPISLEAFRVFPDLGFKHLGGVVPPAREPTLLECLQVLGYAGDPELLAQLEHDPAFAESLLESCRSNDTDLVRRGLFRGNALFALGDRSVTAYSLDAFTGSPLSRVSLDDPN